MKDRIHGYPHNIGDSIITAFVTRFKHQQRALSRIIPKAMSLCIFLHALINLPRALFERLSNSITDVINNIRMTSLFTN